MSWLIWCLVIYFASLWAAIKFCKASNNEVKRDDLPLILVPVFNTIVVLTLTFVTVKEHKMWSCLGDSIAKVLNKL